jgi:mycothiol synthase
VETEAIRRFIDHCTAVVGFRPLSDQAWSDLGHGVDATLITVRLIDDSPGRRSPDSDATVAYAQATLTSTGASDSVWTIETVFTTQAFAEIVRLGGRLLALVLKAVLSSGGTRVEWLVQNPINAHEALAATFGLTAQRRLYQMRRPLPTGLSFDVRTRSFDPLRDLDDWVRLNSRAFEWNPEQGSWTAANVLARMDEPWFDPLGFLIHERVVDNGAPRMAGFCWTKIHDGPAPLLGEIYVIAVDPDFHGLGLGRALTLAGLDSLARRGSTIGMLFVDADNVAAVALYDKLGFTIHRTDCMYEGQIAAADRGDTDELN